MKCKRKKATFGVLAPNIQRGGMAIPLGNNLYWMKGRKHKTGGIDIGKDLEVENNEVMQMLPNETRVFSSVKMLGGNSPAELVASGMNPNMVFNAQETYKRINRIRDDGSKYKEGGKAKLGKRIKIKTNDGDRDIYYDDVKRRWVWDKNKVLLPYGHRIKFPDGYEYQLNSDGTQTRIGKKPNAAERAVTAPMKYTPNNDIPTAALDVMTAPLADDDKLYYNGILPLHNPSIYKDAPLYAYRTGDMSYLRNDDTSIYTPVRRARQDLPRKLYEFYNQDTIYMPSSLIESVDKLKQGITINQENVDPSYVYGPNNKIAIDARNHNMQIRDLGNNNYVADFSDVFDTNKEFFDSKANPMIFSQFGVPIVFTDDETKINQSFINEVNNALRKKYGGKQMNLQNIDNPLARYGKRKIYKPLKGAKAHWEVNERGEKVLVPNNTIEYGGGQFGGAGAGASWGGEETVEPKTNQLDVVPLPETRTFNEAYSEARREKKKTFIFNGREYSTAYSPNVQNWRQAGDSRVEVTGYGLGARWRKPLGGIVRFDGAGRDRLAYIPSTGSSQQDMKCGGRVKALAGINYTNPLLRYIVDRNGNWGYNGIGYGVPNASHIGMYQDEADQYIPESNKGEIINGDENIAVIPTDDNSTTPILVDTRTHKTNGTNVYSTKRSTPVLPQLSTVPSAIKDLKTMNFNRLIPASRNNISSYLDIVNDITKGESDWQGYAAAGVNALGSVINSLIMNNALRKQRPPVRPVPKIAQKLKTKYNINPQLSENREATAQAVKDVARNTASSQVGRNLINSLGLQRAIADNKLFAEKENKETELINKDIVNRQSVDHENVDTYNKWLEARNDFYNNRSLLRAQNWATLVNGISSQIGAGLGNIGASRRYRNNVLLAMLPYMKATGNG